MTLTETDIFRSDYETEEEYLQALAEIKEANNPHFEGFGVTRDMFDSNDEYQMYLAEQRGC